MHLALSLHTHCPRLLRTPPPWRHVRGLSSSTPCCNGRQGSDSPPDLPSRKAPDSPSTNQNSLLRTEQRLRGWLRRTISDVRERTGDVTKDTLSSVSNLGLQLNKMSGYQQIEVLKNQVVQLESRLNESRQAARDAKSRYAAAVLQRARSQREVNDLLQRKATWTDSDVSQFTKLVRLDHSHEQEEMQAKGALDETDDIVERRFGELMRGILARYHEEQVWSDKIRSASTYGSLVALGLNLFVFAVAIAVVEPWKRKRMASAFEDKVEEMSLQNKIVMLEGVETLGNRFEEQRLLIQSLQDSVEALHQHTDDETAPGTPQSLKGWNGVSSMLNAGSAAIGAAIGWVARGWKVA